MKKTFAKFLSGAAAILLSARAAGAFEHKWGANTVRLTAAGSAGALIDSGAAGDYLLRAQLFRETEDGPTFGAIYAIDRLAVDGGRAARDAFLYVETKHGRIEAGWTESVASKLALTLPDVGGARLNNSALFYGKDFRGITNPTIRGNQYAWRVNVATAPNRPWQFGIGQSIYASGFNSSTDFGARYRNPSGRTKTSLSFGASRIDRPRGMIGDNFLPAVSADARYQGTIGFNLQYGSIVWTSTVKAVVDDNPVGQISDGLQAGTGASYDFLSWSAGVDYIFSDVGLWRNMKNTIAHTAVLSARRKINKYLQIRGSAGIVAMENKTSPFFIIDAGLSF